MAARLNEGARVRRIESYRNTLIERGYDDDAGLTGTIETVRDDTFVTVLWRGYDEPHIMATRLLERV